MNKLLMVMCILFSPVYGWSAPLDRRHLPQDTTWVMHLDMEALRDSALAETLRDQWLTHDKVRKHLDHVRKETGIDPSEDILGATIFDSKFKKHHGVAMIHVRNADGQKLLARLNEKEPENRMVEFGPHKIYLWTKDHHHGGKAKYTVCGTLYEDQLMIFSRDLLQVLAVLDVLDGKKAGLPADSSLGAETSTGTILLMRGKGLEKVDHKLRCPVLKESKWFEVEIGARDGRLFTNMLVDTNDAEVAINAKGVMEGFRALANLRHKDEGLQNLLSGLKVSASGTQITAEWSAEESATLKAMESLVERRRKGVDKWKKWRKGKKP